MCKRVAIIGSRCCTPIDMEPYLPFAPDIIVSGGARGIDTYAKEFALRSDIPIVEYMPDYRRYGRKAPLIRNIQIVDNCDFLLAFWNGISRGTRFTIDYAIKRGVPFKVVRIT